MVEDKKDKRCNCKSPKYPENLPSAPTEYHGQGLCGKCEGMIKFPISKEDYKPSADETRKVEIALSLQGTREFLKSSCFRSDCSIQVDLVPALLLLHIAESLGVIAGRLVAMEGKKDKDSKRN